MIILGISRTLPYNIGIDVFCSIITLIIYYSYKTKFPGTRDICLLRRITLITVLILLTDMGMWVLDGKSGNFMHILSYTVGITFFISEIVITFGWLKYAGYRIFSRRMPKKEKRYYVLIPFAVLGLMVITTPLTGWCFYLDEANYYHRGIFAMPLYAFLLAYLLSISIIALVHYKKEVFIDRKRELLTIAFFVVPPLLGGIIQTVFYGLSIVWPCAVISSLLVLLNKEDMAISQDFLTELNNRRSMEKYLMMYEEDKDRAVTMIIMDINNFKKINDKYGHSSGDTALIETANILRAVFGGTPAFLARYGGDEFIIILPEDKKSIIEETIQVVKNGFESFNETKQLPYTLSVSIGYAISTDKADNRTARLLEQADENMYRDKTLYYGKSSSQKGYKDEEFI